MEPRLNTKQVQEIYGVSLKTLSEWRNNRGMPHRKIGRECFYLVSELEEWDRAHKVPLERSPLPADRPKSHIQKRGLSSATRRI